MPVSNPATRTKNYVSNCRELAEGCFLEHGAKAGPGPAMRRFNSAPHNEHRHTARVAVDYDKEGVNV